MSYCVPNISKIKFLSLQKNELNKIKAFSKSRFRVSTTVKGTRAFYHFTPLSATRMGAKRISDDDQFALN